MTLTSAELPGLEFNLAWLEFRMLMLIVPVENKVRLLSGTHLCSQENNQKVFQNFLIIVYKSTHHNHQ